MNSQLDSFKAFPILVAELWVGTAERAHFKTCMREGGRVREEFNEIILVAELWVGTAERENTSNTHF